MDPIALSKIVPPALLRQPASSSQHVESGSFAGMLREAFDQMREIQIDAAQQVRKLLAGERVDPDRGSSGLDDQRGSWWLGRWRESNLQPVGVFTFKVGTGNQSYDSLTFTVTASSASALGVLGTDQSGLIGITTANLAETASTAVSAAIDTLNQSRSDIGAAQNRLTFAANFLATSIENMEAARSTLLDLDVAAEITVFTSKQILIQTGVAMLAQANQLPQNLLRLFQ